MSSNLFTPDALAILRQMQRDTMPATIHVLTPTLVKEPGGVARATWAKTRTMNGRISRQVAETRESGDAGARFPVRTFVLAYPHDAPPLDGTECVIVEGGDEHGTPRFVHVLRVTAPNIGSPFATRRTATASDLNVPSDINVADFIANP
jgi:hypothetical protein